MLWILCLFWREGDIFASVYIRSLRIRIFSSLYTGVFSSLPNPAGVVYRGLFDFPALRIPIIYYNVCIHWIQSPYPNARCNILYCSSSSSSTYIGNRAVDRRVFTSRSAVRILKVWNETIESRDYTIIECTHSIYNII